MIVEHFLDSQDWYKMTMGSCILCNFSDVWVRWKFKCRNEGIIWTRKMLEEIYDEIIHLCSLRVTEEEIEFVRSVSYIPKGYPEFLKTLQLDKDFIKISLVGTELVISVEGPWYLTTYFEIPVLAIVNEVYFRNTNPINEIIYLKSAERVLEKANLAKENGLHFSDFGTRRRFSRSWQNDIISNLTKNLPRDIFTGTSNPYFAMKYNITPIGTMAHEFLQVSQAFDNVSLANSQKHMLQVWLEEYRGKLSIALSDTLGFDKFLKDFDLYFAKLYDGVRHDSGDPYLWGNRMLAHYENLNIDPKTKTLVFSDGLSFPLAVGLNIFFKDKINVSFGIGTNLTNDIPGVTPLQIVMKIVEVNGKPVAKISDNPAKGMCEDLDFLNYLKKVCND
jgi:nicotinate phosphoribosyltransferase